MNHHHREHIRQHARRHHERHLRLKELLRHAPPKEKIGGIFVATFLIAMISLVIYANWGVIFEAFKSEMPPVPPQVHGFKTGVKSVIKIEEQATQEYRNLLASIPTSGSVLGVQNAYALSQEHLPPLILAQSIYKAVQATWALSTGQVLTKLEHEKARALQKSVLTTYYLGRKSIDIRSALQNDTQILSQIKNVLSVDLFAYLNQSSARADALEGYLRLLESLLEKTNQRLMDLDTQIAFLRSNFQAQETQVQLSEQAFLNHLQALNGPHAQESLGQFIGLEAQNVENKAKIGAYNNLRQYYAFFKPRLETLVTAIRANRDPLIAGVKVVEIENMTLPLIIRQQ